MPGLDIIHSHKGTPGDIHMVSHFAVVGCGLVLANIWEWISNFISDFIMDVITYPCLDYSELIFIKWNPGDIHIVSHFAVVCCGLVLDNVMHILQGLFLHLITQPDSKIHGANLGPPGSCWTCLTLITAWISNYIHYKVWDEITYPFLNFNGCTVEV